MAQTSTNRDEPSMEDILSSIRKIIQSNEEKDGGSSDEQTPEGIVAQSKVVDTPLTSGEADPAAQGALGDVAPQPEDIVEDRELEVVVKPVEQSSEEEKTVSASQVRVSRPVNAAESFPANAEVQSERGELTDAPARAPQAVVQAAEENVSSVEVAVETVSEAPATAEPISSADPEPNKSPAVPESVASTQQGKPNSPPNMDRTPPAEETQNSVPALLSSDSGEKVAASFAALTQSLEDRAEKNIEDMASEMLRPMLQDWLDDNLPSLVERLVREEIERVARGG